MRVLVAGASGAVGQYLVPMLVERGHEVHGTTTRQDKFEQIARAGATPVLMDGLDAASVRKAVADARPEAIIHEMTALRGKVDFKHFDRWFAKTNELRTKGTANLLDAAATSGTTKRFIAQSYSGWTSAVSDGPATTEDEPFDPRPLPQQSETLAAIQQMESLVRAAPLDGIVLRYANLYSRDSLADVVDTLKN